MGNLSSIDFTAPVVTSGSNSSSSNPDEFLDLNQKIQSTALFNDAFISSIVDKLPSFGIEDPAEEGSSGGGSSESKSGGADGKENPFEQIIQSEEHRTKLLKLMKIFAPENKSPERVEDHPILSNEGNGKSAKSQSGFEIMRLRRTRLLIQLFKVIFRFL